MTGNHEKSGLQKPTLIEKLANDPMRYILFFTSFSVILITLGIIQTLLFEAVTFFQDIADSRGWFGLDVEMDGIFSAQGVAGVLLLGCLFVEILGNRSSLNTEKIPQKVLFPGDFVVRLSFFLLPIAYILYDDLLLVIALLLSIITWRKVAAKSILSSSSDDGPADRTFATVLGAFAFISLFSHSQLTTLAHSVNFSSRHNGRQQVLVRTEGRCVTTCPLVLTAFYLLHCKSHLVRY